MRLNGVDVEMKEHVSAFGVFLLTQCKVGWFRADYRKDSNERQTATRTFRFRYMNRCVLTTYPRSCQERQLVTAVHGHFRGRALFTRAERPGAQSAELV